MKESKDVLRDSECGIIETKRYPRGSIYSHTILTLTSRRALCRHDNTPSLHCSRRRVTLGQSFLGIFLKGET